MYRRSGGSWRRERLQP
ncbi:MAG: hypothetical protein ACJ73Y_04890 [Rubrobacteraceae bacterium]